MWTATTASHSASDMENTMRSRRMPALLMSTSRRPKTSTASATMRPASSKSVTSAPLAIAAPPWASISATTSLAGPRSDPVPSVAAAEVVHDDIGALRRQHQRVLAADAAPRARHDRHPAFAQPGHHPSSLADSGVIIARRPTSTWYDDAEPNATDQPSSRRR